MNELISVVVPIYKVEEYLENCVESIRKQTYQNIEIILVDDGSPDACPKICDQYKRMDSRVRVIHKENGGLSDARNFGINAAEGKYITFIDSDDYISPDYIEYLYTILNESNADISICDLIKTSKMDEYIKNEDGKIEEFNSSEAIQTMLYAKKFSTSSCGKMYKMELFDGVEFPKGKYSEDMFTTYRVLERANKVVYGNRICYYYLRRPNSIITSNFSEKHLDVFEALHIMKQSGILKTEGEVRAYRSQIVSSMAELMEKRPPKNSEIKKIWDEAKAYRLNTITDSNAPKRVRAQAFLMLFGYDFALKVITMYYKHKWR